MRSTRWRAGLRRKRVPPGAPSALRAPLLEPPAQGPRAHPEHPGDLRLGHAEPEEPVHLPPVHLLAGPPDSLPLEPRPLEPRLRPLRYHLPLQVVEDREKPHDYGAGPGLPEPLRQVALLDRVDGDARLYAVVEEVYQGALPAREPRDLEDDHSADDPAPHQAPELLEPGPLVLGAALHVLEPVVHVVPGEPPGLQPALYRQRLVLGLLPPGGDAEVDRERPLHRHARPGRPG